MIVITLNGKTTVITGLKQKLAKVEHEGRNGQARSARKADAGRARRAGLALGIKPLIAAMRV